MWPRMTTGAAAALLLASGTFAGTGVGASATGADHHGASGPENGRIFFSTGFILPNPDTLGVTGQVYSMRADGSDLRQLTHVAEGSAAGAPSVSSDGRTVAYVNNESGDFELWLMDADGSHQRELLATPGTDYFTPSWSPDGSRLLLTSCDNTIPGEPDCPLVTVRANGTGLTTLVSNHRVNYSASYSPDGRKIQFSSDQEGLLGAIWIARADGSHQQRLTDPDLDATFAAWSPDGRSLVFGDNCCRPNSNVYTIDVDGRHLRQLTHVRFGDGDANFPAYSPDGRFIVFSRISDADGFALWVMRSDGSHQHAVESSVPFAVQSSWGAVPGTTRAAAPSRVPRAGSTVAPAVTGYAAAPATTHSPAPDGRIAVTDTSSGVVDTVNPDGGALVQVTTPEEGFALQATWTPDGSHLVVAAVGTDDELRLYEVAADGSDWHLLVPDAPGFADFGPRVSPDGRSVFFVRCRPDPLGGCAIAAARIDGTRLHQVTDFASPQADASEFFFAISPDGSRLAYGEEGLGGIADQVYVSDIDGRHARAVTKPALEAMPSDWTSDGRSVLVTSAWRHLGSEIFAVSANRRNPSLVVGTTYPRSVFFPDQSPSGASLTFVGEGDEPRLASFLFVAASDGSGQQLIDIGSDSANYPQWGTAPLLPASARTPVAERAPLVRHRKVRQLRSLLPSGLGDVLLPRN
jgi:Tol biopolymer transport system component